MKLTFYINKFEGEKFDNTEYYGLLSNTQKMLGVQKY